MGLSLTATQTAITYVFRGVPGEGGWAHCTVNNATGELSIQSDWGSWAHCWSPDPGHLGAPSLTAFIGGRGNVDYLARKLQHGGGHRWSAAGTSRGLRRQLCQRRLEDGREQLGARLEPDERAGGRGRHDEEGRPLFSFRYVDAPTWNDPLHKEQLPYLTRDIARSLWRAIGETADSVSSPDLFFERILQIEGFSDYVTEEPWECSVTEQTSRDRALREIVLPALIRACRDASQPQGVVGTNKEEIAANEQQSQ